jgi:hypothetical protein
MAQNQLSSGEQPAAGINAPNNQGIITQGQSGGQNIVNQAPPPAAIQTSESEWIRVPEGVRKDVTLKMQSPAEINKLTVIVHGENLASVGFYFDQKAMMRSTGEAKSGPGWISHETSTPSAVRGIGIIATKPTKVDIETKVE